MASNYKKIAKQLTQTEGMVLRYVVSTDDQPVEPSRVINHIEWSALPHTFLEAKKILEALFSYKLVDKQTDKAYTHTELGCKVLTFGDTNDLWEGTLVKNPSSRRNFA